MGLLHHRYYSEAAEPEPWRPPLYREIQKRIGMILREQYAPPKELPHHLLALVIEADNVVVVEPGIGGCSMQTANFAGRAAECERMAQSTRDPENKAIWERMADRCHLLAEIEAVVSLSTAANQNQRSGR